MIHGLAQLLMTLPKKPIPVEERKTEIRLLSLIRVIELGDNFFRMPVIRKSCFVPEKLSMVRDSPSTFIFPKYFIAVSSVNTAEKGSFNAVRGLPYSSGKPYIGSRVLSPI